MPFADWNRPSFALSQLATLLNQRFDDAVSADVHYLNQDIAQYIGAPLYESISVSADHVNTGLGDWLFRQIAFPDASDNAAEYFRRFYRGQRWTAFRERILELRSGLRQFLTDLLDCHHVFDADVVGFSSMFAQHVPCLAAARLIKDHNPNAIVVIGGANCEAPMGSVIAEHVPAVDFVFSGPALDTFTEFMRHVLDGRPEAADAIPGVVSRRNCHDPKFAAAVGRDHDINDLIRPDYASFLNALDDHPDLRRTGSSEPMLFFETSRGCWWGERSHCTFCGLNGQSMGYRAMAPEAAIDQFKWLFGFASDYPKLFCTDNVMPRHYPKEVFAALDPPPGTSIFYEVKLPLSRKDLARMASGAVTAVQPGIEALATSTLKLMRKGTTAFQNLQFLKSCVEFGINPDWNLLIGFPGEEESVYQTYERIIPLLTHLSPPSAVYTVRFDRFSPYFTMRDDYGLDLRPMDYYALTYPFDTAALAQLAYFFADHSFAPYMRQSIAWYDRLRALVDNWRDARLGDGATPRELRLIGSSEMGWSIRDSRDGTTADHPVEEPTVRLLHQLSSPRRRTMLSDDADAAARLDWMTERGFLFEEDGRVLSLVLVDANDSVDNESDDPPAAGQRLLLPLLGEVDR
ncbi:RiPP maturation radical SAM C-methyltransferase [Saccharopolyspora gloriosae]|uniref:RiPP maturation radical SAM C-methyltransferase n=1 Tax=Saccharopolyspora gloriosae TaxID=455344 RepID=UPI001FB6EE1E|nr:RiPP maturation radical SAM C-methyltransferase [Saccharopolyspora gloriosae]